MNLIFWMLARASETVTESRQASVTYAAPSGAGNNITFTFDATEHPSGVWVGQFANGDYWCRPDSPGGVVKISAISPAVTGSGLTTKNGYELNPSTSANQGFDGTSDSLITFSTVRSPALPMTVTPSTYTSANKIASLVKVVSLAGSGVYPQYQFNAVLTIVDAPIGNSENKFRPAYFGNSKYCIPVGAINTSALGTFPSWSPTRTFGALNTAWAGLKMKHMGGYTVRVIAAVDTLTQSGDEYGNSFANDTFEFISRFLCSDFNISNATHKSALYGGIQTFIDLAGQAIGGIAWHADGGHNLGRKLPLVFCQKIMPSWASWFSSAITTHEATTPFQEDGQTYIPASIPNDGTRSARALFGRTSGIDDEAYYWNTIRSGGVKDVKDPYFLIDGSVDDAANVAGPGTVATKAGFYVGANYQGQTGQAYRYNDTVARMLGITTEWGTLGISSAPFEYAQRWRSFGGWASPDTKATYDGNDANYGVTYGVGIAGAGRAVAQHGNKEEGSYSNTDLNTLDAWYQNYISTTPVFVDATYGYDENQTAGVTIASAAAHANSYQANYSYSITAGNSSGYFQINSTTGAISLTSTGATNPVASNDYETGTNTFALTVQVSDSLHSTSDTATITLNVQNVADTPAAAFDAVSNFAASTYSGATTSWTHTPVAEPSGVVVVLVTDDAAPTSVTYGGVAMTLRGSYSSGSRYCHHYMLGRTEGGTNWSGAGAKTVLVTWSAAGRSIEGGCISVTNSDPATPYRNNGTALSFSVSGSADNAPVTVTGVSLGDLVIGSIWLTTVNGRNAAQTLAFDHEDLDTYTMGETCYKDGANGSVTCNWDLTTGSGYIALATAIRVAP